MDKRSEIAITGPHTAFAAFIYGVCHKYTYMMRTIANISDKLKVLDKTKGNFFSCLLNIDNWNRTSETRWIGNNITV